MKSYGTRYEVYTRPELYEIDRPSLPLRLKIGVALGAVIVMVMLRAAFFTGLLHH